MERSWRRAVRAGYSAAAGVAVVALLGFLTAGLLLFDRGLLQDDAAALHNARVLHDRPWHQRLHAIGEAPTRKLSLLDDSLAVETPDPLRTLQAMLLGSWLATALLAGALGRRLLPGGEAAGAATALLVATASSDFLTGSLVGLGYQQSVAFFLAAFLAAHVYVRAGRWWMLLLSTALLLLSLWTIDVAALTFPLALAWLALVAPREQRRRAFVLSAVWMAAALPYLVAFAAFLRGPYARAAVQVPRQGALRQVAGQLVFNFAAWKWVRRTSWYAPPRPLLPPVVAVAVAAAAALLALGWWSRPQATTAGAFDRRRALVAAGALGVLLLVANGPTTFVQLADIHFRTHLLSRVWASMFLALIAAALLQHGRPARIGACALVGGFTFLGLWGGLERQDYFFSLWLDQRAELASIVAACPRLPDDTQLVLVDIPHARFAATQAPYLAAVWGALLYDEPRVLERTTLASAERGTTCEVEPAGLRCRMRGLPCGGISAGMPCPQKLLVPGKVIILAGQPRTGTYARAAALPPAIVDPLRVPPGFASAAPLPTASRLERWRRRLLIEPATPWAKWLARRRLELSAGR
ncbi:MAG TPA: hypothetical protein VGS57_06045 [Thermoanaerobaculia bacterium]|jgi:MFS family permease|nr:hypothetical protein [Thermoanaerobaculia bacterium]